MWFEQRLSAPFKTLNCPKPKFSLLLFFIVFCDMPNWPINQVQMGVLTEYTVFWRQYSQRMSWSRYRYSNRVVLIPNVNTRENIDNIRGTNKLIESLLIVFHVFLQLTTPSTLSKTIDALYNKAVSIHETRRLKYWRKWYLSAWMSASHTDLLNTLMSPRDSLEKLENLHTVNQATRQTSKHCDTSEVP